MTIQYDKNRSVGGFSVYARSYGEGLMLFTNNQDHDNMIPVWVSRFVANRIREAVENAEKQFWDDGFMAWRDFVWRNFGVL